MALTIYHTYSVGEVKRELSIIYLLADRGIHPATKTSRAWKYHSPFREDRNPSFDVYLEEDNEGEIIERWGDFGDDSGGDVIDLIMRFDNCTFDQAMVTAKETLAQQQSTEWDYPKDYPRESHRPEPIAPGDVEVVQGMPVVTASNLSLQTCLATRPALDVAVAQAFGVRARPDGSLALPHPDWQGIALRFMDGAKAGIKGSNYGLYHHPDLDPYDTADSRPLLVCEGHTDTWAAHRSVGEDFRVVGIVNDAVIGHLEGAFEGREVVLSLDADTAGRNRTVKLLNHVVHKAANVSVVPVPAGRDLSSLTVSTVRDLVARRRTPVINTSNLEAGDIGIHSADEKGQVDVVANWSIMVDQVLDTGDPSERIFVCRVHLVSSGPYHEPVRLSASDMASPKDLNDWAQQSFRGSWWGSARQTYQFGSLIEEQASFATLVRAVSRPSLNAEGFVLPDQSIGTEALYVHPENTKYDTRQISSIPFDSPGDEHVAGVLETLVKSHTLEVMQPILAWLAMAPLRSLYPQFPILFISGAAGSGKTTLVDNVLRLFSGVVHCSTLTSTTPYAVSMAVGATNCLPMWFDEYRPGGRITTLMTLDQLIRDAYTATPSTRGGLGSDRSVIHALPTDAPIVISGEDMADEQSHRDRLVRVWIPREGKGMLASDSAATIAGAYLRWLAEDSFGTRRTVTPPVLEPLDLDVSERQRHNLSILAAGWTTLQEFATEMGTTLPDADWTTLTDMATQDRQENVIAEILADVYDRYPGTGGVEIREDDPGFVYVRPNRVLQVIQSSRMVAPFRTGRALVNHLVTELEATEAPAGSYNVRSWKISTDKVFPHGDRTTRGLGT